MNEHTDFIAYCIEEYKYNQKMTGKAVIDLFNEYNVIDYIRSCYDVLHTTGGLYIIDDINQYIELRSVH